jgi:hypothetical protein
MSDCTAKKIARRVITLSYRLVQGNPHWLYSCIGLFIKSGKHQPNFYKFFQKKPQMYYYGLYAESKPNLHKASVIFAR